MKKHLPSRSLRPAIKKGKSQSVGEDEDEDSSSKALTGIQSNPRTADRTSVVRSVTN